MVFADLFPAAGPRWLAWLTQRLAVHRQDVDLGRALFDLADDRHRLADVRLERMVVAVEPGRTRIELVRLATTGHLVPRLAPVVGPGRDGACDRDLLFGSLVPVLLRALFRLVGLAFRRRLLPVGRGRRIWLVAVLGLRGR